MNKLKLKDGPDSLRRALTLSALGMAGAGTALGLTGCGGDDDDDHDDRDQVSVLRFANATDVNPIDFRLNGETIFTGLAGGGRVSTYGEVRAGNAVIAARAPSGPPDLATVATTLVEDRFTSIVAHGRSGGPSIELTVFEETNTQPSAGSTRIRVFHAASNNLTALNVHFSMLTELNLPATPTFSLGAYEALSAFQSLDSSASYRIRITPAGSTQLLFDSGSASGVNFASRSVITLLVVPTIASGTQVNLSALPEQAEGGQIGEVR